MYMQRQREHPTFTCPPHIPSTYQEVVVAGCRRVLTAVLRDADLGIPKVTSYLNSSILFSLPTQPQLRQSSCLPLW